MTIWGDLWFYVSAFGLASSCALFGFFLRQYRAAAATADEPEVESADLPKVVPVTVKKPMDLGDAVGVKPAPVAPVRAEPIPLKADKPLPVASAPAPAPQAAAKPFPAPAAAARPAAASPAPAAASPAPQAQASQPLPAPPGPAAQAALASARPKPDPATTTGGISPAIVYLQNVKLQMEAMEKEISGLKGLVAKANSQDELILKRLIDLGEQFKSLKAAPAPQPAQPAPAAVPAPSAPAPQAAPPPTPVPAPLQPAAASPTPVRVRAVASGDAATVPGMAAPLVSEGSSARVELPAPTILPALVEPSPPAQAPVSLPPTPAPVAPEAAPPKEPQPAATVRTADPGVKDDSTIALSAPVVLDAIPQAKEEPPAEGKVRKGPVWPI